MIDYFSLALGHGLLALALLRLVMRDALDSDPAIARLEQQAREEREAASVEGRNARRRQRADSGSAAPTPETDTPPPGEASGQ